MNILGSQKRHMKPKERYIIIRRCYGLIKGSFKKYGRVVCVRHREYVS